MKTPAIAPRAAELATRPPQAPTRTEMASTAPFASVFATALQPPRASARRAERDEPDTHRTTSTRDEAHDEAREADARSDVDGSRAAVSAATERQAHERGASARDARERVSDAREAHDDRARVSDARDVVAHAGDASGDVSSATEDNGATRGAGGLEPRAVDAASVPVAGDPIHPAPTDAAATTVAANAGASVATAATAATAATVATVAANVAANVAAPVAPRTASTIDRATSALAPEFREKLERVIDRMREELGHTVEIVETYRSQSRQDALYAQGRTRPGDVVTWTRDSNHTAGLAADLTIDGGYDDAAAFVSLARIAREEGLRTLGPRDPGHLELASGAAQKASSLAAAAQPTPRTVTIAGPMMAAPAPVAGVAPVAFVANVASIATAANVATVAAVPQPGVAATAPSAGRESASRVRAAPGDRAPRGDARGTGDVAAANRVNDGTMADEALTDRASLRGANAPTRAEATRAEEARTDARDDAAVDRVNTLGAGTAALETDASRAVVAADLANGSTGARGTTQGGTAAIAHSDAAERIARVLKLRDDSADKTLSNLLLRIDHPDGTQDRIRVDRRGLAIGATLEMSDASSADQLRANVGELQRALERAGLQTDGVAVRGIDALSARSGITGLTGGAAAIAAEREAMRDALRAGAMTQNGNTPRDRQDRSHTPTRDQRAPSDSNRHRSRREQRGNP